MAVRKSPAARRTGSIPVLGTYYAVLEDTQVLKSDQLEITDWLKWYVQCMGRAIDGVLSELDSTVRRKEFWEETDRIKINERQRKILGLLVSGDFKGKLTSSKWALICKCSQDSAGRDIKHLLEAGLLEKSETNGRSTYYSLRPLKPEHLDN